MTPTIQASQELEPCVDVLKTHGEMKRSTPNTRETQSCQRVHAFITDTAGTTITAQIEQSEYTLN